MSDDMMLIQEYAQSNSEQAFATLVSQHVNLVYSVALRQVHDPHLAEEVTQAVFILLARKAKSLSPKTILSGWLCRTARNLSANTLKIQRRRQFHEQESHMESILDESESDPWAQVAPHLDEALNCLGQKEHDAVVLRFFDGKDLKHVGAAMGTTEDGARMRVNRGLERLREFFTKRGVTLSTAAIAGAVSANSVQAAPAGLAAAITVAALSGSTITTTAVIAATKAIAMTTLQKTFIISTAAVLTGGVIIEARQLAKAHAEAQTLRQQLRPMTDEIQQLQGEREETARQIASLREENEKLNGSTGELLRLRGEVGRLRLESRDVERLRAENHRLHVAQTEPSPIVVGQGQSSTSNSIPLYTRMIKVDTEALLSKSRSSSVDNGDSNPNVVQQSLLQFLKDNGVQIEPPAAAFIDQTNGTLIVRASLASLDKIETLLQDIRSHNQNNTNGGP